jgi:MoxR-like ATPase
LATQNPIELEGTYALPEAQLDRFLFKIQVLRNDAATLERIVKDRELGTEPKVDPILTKENLVEVLELTRRIFLPDPVANYIARLVNATHPGESEAAKQVKFGASPRAALSLASAVKARALLHARTNASFEDVQAIAHAVLCHRIVLDYAARIEGRTTADVVADLLKEVPARAGAMPKPLNQVA